MAVWPRPAGLGTPGAPGAGVKMLVGLQSWPGWTWTTAWWRPRSIPITPKTNVVPQPPALEGAQPGGPEGKFPFGKVCGESPAKGGSSSFTAGPSGHVQGDGAARDVSAPPCPSPSPCHSRRRLLQSCFLLLLLLGRGVSATRNLCRKGGRARTGERGGTERETPPPACLSCVPRPHPRAGDARLRRAEEKQQSGKSHVGTPGPSNPEVDSPRTSVALPPAGLPPPAGPLAILR